MILIGTSLEKYGEHMWYMGIYDDIRGIDQQIATLMTRLERMEIQQTKCPTWILLGYNVFKGVWGGDISP